MAENKTIQFENWIMVEVLKAMQTLGGKLTRKEIKREIREHSVIISEERIDATRISKKNGK